MKMNKLDMWLSVAWVLFIAFVVTDIVLNTQGIYISNTLEVLVGTIFGCAETICCTVIKTNETKASFDYQIEQLKLQHKFDKELKDGLEHDN